ncbi:hypothetical protein B0H15DRAFT_1024977 [Mycena belliarum]|uniref:Uncharacterized protein n=1 Tax=Mycena belliarum TaxID=1033014 RepID=A0AAD6TX21_9AGAR|nr:hypothetical protein B0H15DRAFT_1024977 [Mycena belliae]
MDPMRTAYLNEETPRQLQERLRLYRAHNSKFMEYFPDGTSRELERNDPLDIVLLAKTAFPGILLQQVEQLMNTLRYFLFDLQNSKREIVPHYGPPQTLSNLVFYRQYPQTFGIIIPVQPNNYARFQLPLALRSQLAQTALDGEVEMQQKFAATGNAYYLDAVINRVILNFGREVRKIELQAQLQTMVERQYHPGRASRERTKRRLHWSMVS